MCERLIEEISSKYDISDLDEIQPPSPNTLNEYNINLFNRATKETALACFIKIIGGKQKHIMIIETIKRYASAEKGLGKKILYILACKAKEYNISKIWFIASALWNKKNSVTGPNQTRLEKYYNNLGFTKKGEKTNPFEQEYYTSPDDLIAKIESVNVKAEARTRKRNNRNRQKTRKI